MDFSIYHLRENPFRIGPAISAEDLIWAGFNDLKKNIENRIQFSILTSPSRIVLNWGRYGSGKTHAANYFTRTNATNDLATKNGKAKVKTVKISLPRTTRDPVQAFFRAFLGQIGILEIQKDLKEVSNGKDLLDKIATDTVIKELFNIIIEIESNKLPDVESYLFGDASKTTLGKLGLPFGIKDDEQIVNFIAAYINLITFEKVVFSSFQIWIDEFEDIDTYSKVSQERFVAFLRQLFDGVSNNLLLFLNFTPKTFYEIEDLSVTLSESLASRAKIRIEFDVSGIPEAKNYVKELMSNEKFRIESTQQNVFFPFEEDCVDYILNHIGNLSVRKINEVFSLVLEYGLLNGKKSIDRNFVDKIKDELISWEGK